MANVKSHRGIFSEFGSTTSIHGVPHLISSKSLKQRIFWSIVCLTSSAMFFYLFSKLLGKYYSYPTVINIQKVHVLISILKKSVKYTIQA